MILPPRPEPAPYTHALSRAFLEEVRRAVMSRAKDTDVLLGLQDALIAEFPEDFEMRKFAKKNLFEIAQLVCQGHAAMSVHRTASGELSLVVGD